MLKSITDAEVLRQNWGLVVAAGLLVVVTAIAAIAVYRRSARGQLRRAAKALRAERRRHAAVQKRAAAAAQRVTALEGRAQSVRPRTLTEARETLEDARALEKIAGDRVLVAMNHVRRVIFEEFPPARHDALRRRYLPEDRPDSKPFTF